MDQYAEFLVKKAGSSQDTLRKALLAIGTGLLCLMSLLLFLIIGPLCLILTLAIGCGGYFLLTNQNVEYEYIVTNDTLDIDKIIAKRKRKPLVSASLPACTAFGKTEEAPPTAEACTTVLCLGESSKADEYYLDLETPAYGLTRIRFTPNEAVLACVRAALPPTLR